MTFFYRLRRRSSESRGAAAVEFALLAPLFFMLVFGMFSGGLLFNERSQLTFASREGARYASALPVTQNFTGTVDAYSGTGCTAASSGGTNSGPLWACNVAKDAITAASGDLASTVPNVFVCVAIVQEGTSNTVLTLNGSTYYYDTASGSTGTCFNDGGADQARRIHVLVRRNGSLNAVLFSMPITLTSQGIARAEQQS